MELLLFLLGVLCASVVAYPWGYIKGCIAGQKNACDTIDKLDKKGD